MGILRDIFEVKEKIWEGTNMDVYHAICKALRTSNMKIQAFKLNQETPKCSGECGSCASKCGFDENTPFYEKIGTGFTDNLLKEKSGVDIYDIYVKKSDVERARIIIKETLCK